MNRPLTIACMFGCGHKINGFFSDDALIEIMNEHYHLVHAAEIQKLVNGPAESA